LNGSTIQHFNDSTIQRFKASNEPRLELQSAHQAHRPFRHVPPGVDPSARIGQSRPAQCSPGPAGAFPAGRGNVRDTWLAASGLLARDLGGPSVRPPLPADIAAIATPAASNGRTATARTAIARSLCVLQRTVPLSCSRPSTRPDSTAACTRRERFQHPLASPHAAQRPGLLRVRPRPLGRRMTTLHGDTASRLRFAFEHCLGERQAGGTGPTRATSPRPLAPGLARRLAHRRRASRDDLDEFVTGSEAFARSQWPATLTR